jgi:hypothetical protein
MGTEGRSSPIPRTYRDTKMLIMNVYNATLWLAPATSEGNQPFKIEPPKYPRPK